MITESQIQNLLKEISLYNSERAYKQLFLQMYGPLHDFARAIVKSPEDAEEVVSDFFIAIWQRRAALGLIETPKMYFFTGVKNKALTKLKANNRQSLPTPIAWESTLSSVFFNPEELLLSAEMVQKIMQAVNELPPKCRMIFKLVKEDGLRYAEVADLLELSLKTVEAQMAIALRKIRANSEFKNEFPELHSLLTQKK